VVINPTVPPTSNIGWMVVETTPSYSNGVWSQSWLSQFKSRQDVKNDVSDKRYEVEVGGVRIANNLYATDRESQNKYIAVAIDISQSNTETWSIVWKTQNDEFVNLNANQMTEVISGVRQHVQSCYAKEAEYYQLINVSDTTTLESTDFSAGWPSNN
jgi:hypothetical protein